MNHQNNFMLGPPRAIQQLLLRQKQKQEINHSEAKPFRTAGWLTDRAGFHFGYINSSAVLGREHLPDVNNAEDYEWELTCQN